jgi:cytidylate kinase
MNNQPDKATAQATGTAPLGMTGVNVITVSRQYGAGASDLARMLSGRLGFRVVDDELLTMAAERSGMDLEKIERVYEQRPSFQDLRVYKERSEKYITAVNEVLEGLAREGTVIIVGRGANLALLSYRNVFNLRLVADFAVRVARVVQREGLSEADARKKISESDYARETYYRFLFNVQPDDPLVYDLILNTSRLTMEEAAAMVTAAFEAVRAARSS